MGEGKLLIILIDSIKNFVAAGKKLLVPELLVSQLNQIRYKVFNLLIFKRGEENRHNFPHLPMFI